MSRDLLQEVYAPRNDAVSAQVDGEALTVTTQDGRTIRVPMGWFPFLVEATPEQRQRFRVLGTIIVWDDLDDAVSMEIVLLGRSGT